MVEAGGVDEAARLSILDGVDRVPSVAPLGRKRSLSCWRPTAADCVIEVGIVPFSDVDDDHAVVDPKAMGWTPPDGIDVPKWRC